MLVRHKDITFVWLKSSIFVSSDQRNIQIFVKMSFYMPSLVHYHLLWRPSLCKVYWSVCRDILIPEICNRNSNKLSQLNWPKDPCLVQISLTFLTTQDDAFFLFSAIEVCLLFFFRFLVGAFLIICGHHNFLPEVCIYFFNYANRFPFDNLTPIMKHTMPHYFCSFILKK